MCSVFITWKGSTIKIRTRAPRAECIVLSASCVREGSIQNSVAGIPDKNISSQTNSSVFFSRNRNFKNQNFEPRPSSSISHLTFPEIISSVGSVLTSDSQFFSLWQFSFIWWRMTHQEVSHPPMAHYGWLIFIHALLLLIFYRIWEKS